MSKKLVAFSVLFAFTVTFGQRRPQDRVPLQLPKMQKLLESAIKSMNDTSTLSNEEVRQLQASANNFQLYIQEPIYVFNKAAGKISDLNYKTHFASLLNAGQESTYGIGRIMNTDPTRIKPVIRNMIQNYYNLLSSPSKKMFEQPGSEQFQLVLNTAEEVYNLGIFNCCLIYVEAKYRNRTNTEIRKEIEAILEKVNILLKKIDSKDVQLSKELVTICRLLSFFTDRIIYKIERWAFTYKGKNPQVEVITGASQILANTVRKLRKSARTSVTTSDLQQALEEYLRDSSTEVKKLATLNTEGLKYENDICKEVILEYLVVVSTLPIKL